MEPEQPALACTVPAAKGRLPDHSPDRRPSAADRLPLYGREPFLRICFRKTDSFAAGMQRREDRCNLRSPIWDSNPYLRIGSPLSWPVGRIGRRYEWGGRSVRAGCRPCGLTAHREALAAGFRKRPAGLSPGLSNRPDGLQRNDEQEDRLNDHCHAALLPFHPVRSPAGPAFFPLPSAEWQSPCSRSGWPRKSCSPVSFCMLVFLPYRGRH